MSGYQDRLQGTDRLLRIRRIRKAVFAGLLALTIVLIFARLEGEGASLKPLFLPVNGILEVALIMGLTFVTYAAVGVTSGSVSVMVKRDNVTVAASQTLTSSQRAVLNIEPSMWADRATWSLVFRNNQSAPTFLTFVLQKGIVPTLFSTVPFLVFLYGAIQIGWWVVLRPIRERTKVTSLRSAAQIDSGERLYDPSAPIPDAPTAARPDRMTSSFVDPPPPNPSVPPPPPTPTPVMRTPKVESPRPVPRTPKREPETADSLVRKAEALFATGTY